MITTKDGSNTLFSSSYNQHYHNINDGAISEALYKHITPALFFCEDRIEINILDICFGLGYNTFATLYYILKNNLSYRINFYSPELNEELLNDLKNFEYPKEFDSIKHIIDGFLQNLYYKDDRFEINLFIGNARDYIRSINNIDIIYQDAFSSDVNSELWSVEYFKDLYKICNENAIITTYSIATSVRLSMYEAGFIVYEYIVNSKKITLAFKKTQNIMGKIVDLELKKSRNQKAKAIYDRDIL